MPIIDSQIVDYSRQKSGDDRARFLFVMSDGRRVLRGPINVSSQADASAKMLGMEANVLLSVQAEDTERAIILDTVENHGEATGAQVKSAWLKKGFKQSEAYRADFYFKKVMPDLIALNKTDEQLSILLGVSVSKVLEIKDKWSYLNANSAALAEYRQIQGGF